MPDPGPGPELARADRMERLAVFARDVLGHEFADLALLDRALTHGSATRQPGASYQRLEFLGDRVLGCVVAGLLYGQHDEAEGRLTARLHAMVEGPANARVARGWNAGPLIAMEPVSRGKGLADSDNVLGDVAEAVTAAVFIDGGWAAASASRAFCTSASAACTAKQPHEHMHICMGAPVTLAHAHTHTRTASRGEG